MPILLQPIREDIIPSIENIDSFRFVGGESRNLALQLLNSYNKKPAFIPSGWDVMVSIPTADIASPINIKASIDSVDRSIIVTALSTTMTMDAISGPLKVSLINMQDLNAESVLGSVLLNTYDTDTGVISIPNTETLSSVMVGDILTDASNNDFLILGVNDVTNAKELVIATAQTLDLSPGASISRSTQTNISLRNSIFTRIRL
jgi:hypothetical protein